MNIQYLFNWGKQSWSRFRLSNEMQWGFGFKTSRHKVPGTPTLGTGRLIGRSAMLFWKNAQIRKLFSDNVCLLQLCIGDATSATWCNMFDATSLFHKSPQELIQMKENSYDDFKVIHTLASARYLEVRLFFSLFGQHSFFPVLRIRDPITFWPLDPGWVKKSRSGSGMFIFNHISESLETKIFG